MNAVEYIRTRVFKLPQAAFAEIAGVSQPTVSRWEEAGNKESEPNREQMILIRSEALKRDLPWSDGWFFQTFPDETATESPERESAS